MTCGVSQVQSMTCGDAQKTFRHAQIPEPDSQREREEQLVVCESHVPVQKMARDCASKGLNTTLVKEWIRLHTGILLLLRAWSLVRSTHRNLAFRRAGLKGLGG